MDAALMFGLWLVVTVASNLYWYRQGQADASAFMAQAVAEDA